MVQSASACKLPKELLKRGSLGSDPLRRLYAWLIKCFQQPSKHQRHPAEQTLKYAWPPPQIGVFSLGSFFVRLRLCREDDPPLLPTANARGVQRDFFNRSFNRLKNSLLPPYLQS